MAHYHRGGVRVSPTLETGVPSLYACGEAIGSSNGANRLSGNAISEAFVFGARAGQNAAKRATSKASAWSDKAAADAVALLRQPRRKDGPNVAKTVADLQTLMATKVGPIRTQANFDDAITKLARSECGVRRYSTRFRRRLRLRAAGLAGPAQHAARHPQRCHRRGSRTESRGAQHAKIIREWTITGRSTR